MGVQHRTHTRQKIHAHLTCVHKEVHSWNTSGLQGVLPGRATGHSVGETHAEKSGPSHWREVWGHCVGRAVDGIK